MSRVTTREIKTCLQARGEATRLIRNLTLMLEEHGLEWDGLDAFHDLRDELCEADIRYGQIHPRGIFLDLEDSGQIRERILSPAQIDAAMERAPEPGRARLRGDWVRRLAGGGSAYSCDWTHIVRDPMYLDLSDPFITEAHWQRKEPRLQAR